MLRSSVRCCRESLPNPRDNRWLNVQQREAFLPASLEMEHHVPSIISTDTWCDSQLVRFVDCCGTSFICTDDEQVCWKNPTFYLKIKVTLVFLSLSWPIGTLCTVCKAGTHMSAVNKGSLSPVNLAFTDSDYGLKRSMNYIVSENKWEVGLNYFVT